jgi:hypothetical protein
LRTDLTDKQAKALIRKIKKNGLNAAVAIEFIQKFAPVLHQDDYLKVWADFLHEAEPLLKSDQSFAEKDGLQLLRRECNVID